MTKANFAEVYAAADVSRDLKFQEGDNLIRVLTNYIAHDFQYDNGDRATRFVCYVWDYASKALKTAYLNKPVSKRITDLQLDKTGYGFEDLPMPYDLNVKVENAGTRNAKFQVLPARENTPVPQEALDALKEAPSIEEVMEQIIEDENKKNSLP